MGAHGGNDSLVRGSACEFFETGHTYTSNAAEGRVLAAGDSRRRAAGSSDTDANDICDTATGKSGGVSGHPDYF